MTSLSPATTINCICTGEMNLDIGPGERNWTCASGICGCGVKVCVGKETVGAGVSVAVGVSWVAVGVSACEVALDASAVIAMIVGISDSGSRVGTGLALAGAQLTSRPQSMARQESFRSISMECKVLPGSGHSPSPKH